MQHANPTLHANGRYTFGSGSRPLDGYTIKRAIGRGGFGEVYYATSDSGKEVALKLIMRNLDVECRGVKECMNLKCPNLLQIFDLKANDSGDTFVVMEYVAGPSLANVLKQHPRGMPEADIRHWMKGLVEGVAYLHDHGIVHRDLKPANLFMEEGIVKIGDYGLAKLITPGQGTDHSESIGTCHYMAPEIGSGKYNKPIDVYAIGVILYEMLTGRVPFEGETVNEVLMKHLTTRPDLSVLNEPYRTIVARALAKDPNARPQRLYELLPPGDAPREPEVRIIGDARAGVGGQNAGRPAAPPQDDVLRIEAEEPVFYIGPETRPPRRQGPTLAQRMRANWQAVRTPGRPGAPRPGGAAVSPASYTPRPSQPQPQRAAPPTGRAAVAVPPRSSSRTRAGRVAPAEPAAGAGRTAGDAQRAGPARRAGLVDALGRPDGRHAHAAGRVRARDRPDAAAAPGGVPLPDDAHGDLDGARARQGARGPQARRSYPQADRRRGRLARRRRRNVPRPGAPAGPGPPA